MLAALYSLLPGVTRYPEGPGNYVVDTGAGKLAIRFPEAADVLQQMTSSEQHAVLDALVEDGWQVFYASPDNLGPAERERWESDQLHLPVRIVVGAPGASRYQGFAEAPPRPGAADLMRALAETRDARDAVTDAMRERMEDMRERNYERATRTGRYADRCTAQRGCLREHGHEGNCTRPWGAGRDGT